MTVADQSSKDHYGFSRSSIVFQKTIVPAPEDYDYVALSGG
jgi:hypothetical protein